MENLRQANTTELKEVIRLLGSGMKLVSDLSDGLDAGDLFDLVAIARDLPPVLKDAKVMWPEYKALDEDARAELNAYVQSTIAFPASHTVEMVVEKVLSLAISLSGVFTIFG